MSPDTMLFYLKFMLLDNYSNNQRDVCNDFSKINLMNVVTFKKIKSVIAIFFQKKLKSVNTNS